MKNKIHIYEPHIIEDKSPLFGNSIKLSTKIKFLNPNTSKEEIKECYFEFKNDYKKYLNDSRSDAFVVGLLMTAMENNYDIEFEKPISERLYYQLTNHFIPVVSKNNKKYPLYEINLIGKTTNEQIKNNNGVATGCSGGVDSFYTIAKYINSNQSKYNLTHLIYTSCTTADNNSNRIFETFSKTHKYIEKLSEDCNLNLIACYNNLHEFYKYPYSAFNFFFTTTFCSIPIALENLIGVYYVNSGLSINEFNIKAGETKNLDGSAFDMYTTSCISDDTITFYSIGYDETRNDKVKTISSYEPSFNNLMVCGVEVNGGTNHEFKNCSHCKKCLRTMFSLYALGKLHNYKNVFDVDDFNKNLSKRIGKLIAIDNYSSFTKYSIQEAKKNNIKIPKLAYFYYIFFYNPLFFLKRKLKKSKIIRKIYYKFNLDIKIDGYRTSKYEYYTKNEDDQIE